MVRIHTISIRKMKSKVLNVVICILAVLFLSKLTWIDNKDISINLKSETDKIPQYIEEQSFDSELYKKILDQTIPYVDEYSNNGQTSNDFLLSTIAFFTGIRWSELNTIIEQIIPTTEYINSTSEQYTQNIIEVDGIFDDYKTKDEEIINQNEEDYYQIEDEEMDTFEDPFSTTSVKYTEAQLRNIDFLQRNLYNFEGNLKLSYNELPTINLMKKNITINKDSTKPQILIIHTHSQENFSDSNPKKLEEGVIGLGEKLAKILHENYGIGVLHHKGQYDVVNGKLMRDGSYERIEPVVRKILKQNPSIEVIIDLHRDGLEGIKLATTVNGKPTAKIMFVNGICKVMQNGKLTDVTSLPNPYLEDNLAFSLQMQLKGNELYPGFLRKLYIKPYRYTLHMLPKSLLVEVGANTNTLEEAQNAMEPLAKILAEVLKLQ